MTDIWYCFYRSDGKFAGSGTPHIDNDECGSTLVPTPEYNPFIYVAVWNGEAWNLELLS